MSKRRFGRLNAGLTGLTEGLRIAFESLAANRFRAGLTILGVSIGVGSVVAMAALITGVRGSVQEGIEAAGPRNFFVTRVDLSDVQFVGGGAPAWMSRPIITVDEAERLDQLSAVENAVMSIGIDGAFDLEWEGTLVSGISGAGESSDWPEYRLVEFVQGRNFVPVEVEEARSVVVVSERLAEDLFGSVDPIGQRVLVSGAGQRHPLTVIGVAAAGESIFEAQTAYFAVIPYTTALRHLAVAEDFAQIIVVPSSDVSIEFAEDQVIGALRSMRGLEPGEDNDFSILRSTQILEFFDQFTAVFFIVMLSLSSIGLIVGGVGVIGIMLISVTERTREIGVRKALGATRFSILWQFLVEAAVLTSLGGAIGLAGGGGLAWLAARLTPVPAAVPAWAVAASLVVAALTGVLFGLAPAARAAQMDPVNALRYE